MRVYLERRDKSRNDAGPENVPMRAEIGHAWRRNGACSQSVNPSVAESVDRAERATYHEEMRPRPEIVASAMLLAGALSLAAGCEDAAKKPVQARAHAPAAVT